MPIIIGISNTLELILDFDNSEAHLKDRITENERP